VEAQLIEVWKRNGWPGKTDPQLPQTKADRSEAGSRTALSEFTFWLSSKMVHFSPPSAVRMGSGKTPNEFAFSPRNFSSHYHHFCRVYSVFITRVIEPLTAALAIAFACRVIRAAGVALLSIADRAPGRPGQQLPQK